MLLLLLAALPARADDRDDDVFGSGPAEPPPALSDGEVSGRLDQAEEGYVAGGRLYLRAQAALPDRPDLAVNDVATSSPNLLDLYGDARPNDRVRGYFQVRARHDPTVEEGDVDWLGEPEEATSYTVDQLWMNFDLWKKVFVTAGRQRVKWGAGRFWNPTDFLDPVRKDPLAYFDERTGVGLVKAHLPFEAARANVYALADFEGADSLDRVGGAVRAEWLVGLTEVALSAARRKGAPERYGAQVTTGLWLLDLKLEGAVEHGVKTKEWSGRFDPAALEFPAGESREDEWIPLLVAGAELGLRASDEDSVTFGAEYFENGLGTDDPDLYLWLLAQGEYVPFYVGRRYGAVYVYVPGPGNWDEHTFSLTTLGNLSDRSFATRVDWSARLLTHLQVNAFAQGHWGENGELRLGLDVPAIPTVTDAPVHVDAPLLDVGVGVAVPF